MRKSTTCSLLAESETSVLINTENMAFVPTVLLNNGNRMPQLGLGTWQIEVSPVLTHTKLIHFCNYHNITITAYSSFRFLSNAYDHADHPGIKLDHPTFAKIAQKYGKTSCQVILPYLIDSGTIPIPKSSNKQRIKGNSEIFDFRLTDEEKAGVDAMNKDYRDNRMLYLFDSEDYPFKEE